MTETPKSIVKVSLGCDPQTMLDEPDALDLVLRRDDASSQATR